MRQSAFVCLLGLVMALSSVPAGAQASRTWVSGVGDDTSPTCSRTAPCKTFAVAFGLTTTGGEINVLDPGGFGSLTINRAVSIYNDGAGEAGIVVSGANAIIINAGTADVNLRGLTLNGQGSGLGVHILAAGSVSIEKCVIQQFGTGVNVASNANIKVHIQDTTILNNTNGVSFQPGAGTVNAAIDRTRVHSNSGIGVLANGAFGGNVYLAMLDSSSSLNGIHGVVGRSGAVGYVLVTLSRANIAGNVQFGIQGDSSSGGLAEIVVGSSLITNNFGGAAQAIGGAALYSNGNNEILFQGPATFTPFSTK